MDHDDLDELLAAGPRPPRPAANECATGWAVRQLDDATADKFRTAMSYHADPDAIAEAFARRGYPDATPLSVKRHALGRCRRCAERSA